jgi:hypothetical protein
MAAMSNLLPGARKSIPYMVETGGCSILLGEGDYVSELSPVIFFWKMIELNKVRALASLFNVLSKVCH